MMEAELNEIIKTVTLEDIPVGQRDVAGLIGIGPFLKICEYAAGDRIYFPTLETVTREARNRKIKKEYREGGCIKQLAKKYTLTPRRIRHIVDGA